MFYLSEKVLCCAVAALMASPFASGEEVQWDDSTTYDLNPVVVTGTMFSQRQKHSPVATMVVSRREILNTGMTNLQDAMSALIPSLSFSPNAMGSYLRMNGLTNSHVLILVNGQKLVGDISGNVDLGQINMNRIKQIEYLTGAASAIYGSDAIGGVINIITDDLTDRTAFSSDSRYTRENQFNQGLNLGLHQGRVGSYTSFNYAHSGGWQNSGETVSGDELVKTLSPLSMGYTTNNFTQKLSYSPTDRLELEGVFNYYHKLTDRPVEQSGITGGSKYNLFYEGYQWEGHARYKLSPLHSLHLDYMGSTYSQAYKYMVASGDYIPGDYQFTKDQKYHDITLTGEFNFAPGNRTIFAADYRRETLKQVESGLDKTLGTFSLFGQHEIRLLNHWTAIAGVRYDNHQAIGSRVTPKVSVMYSVGDFNFRGGYSAGYRTPGIDELYYHLMKPMGSRHIITFGNRNLKAETSNYVSLNAEYRTPRFTFGVTGYMNFVDNMVTSRSTKFTALDEARQESLKNEFPQILDLSDKQLKNLSLKEYYNFSTAWVKGVDISVSGMIIDGLTGSVNYTFAYGKGRNADGSRQLLNRSIRNVATMMLNYTHSWSGYRLNAGINSRMQSKTCYPGDADGNAPGYGIWNINTRHTFTGFRGFELEPSIGVDNIFNKTDNRPLNCNFANYSPGTSLVVGLSIRFK